MSEAPFDVDVLVVGMGPVGKLAALLLGRAGHTVLVTERKSAAYPLPRAVAHDAEIARILQNAGLPPDSMPDAVEPYDDLYVWQNGAGDILHEVDWTGIDPSGWNNTYFYNQPALERHLERELATIDTVHVRRGVTATVQEQSADGVTTLVAETETDSDTDGPTTRVRSRYVLAADGANSGVRRGLGVGWNDLGYFYDWLVVDVLPKRPLPVGASAIQVADPARPTTVVPGGPGRRRWEFMRLEGESKDELTRPERIWQLLEPFGVTEADAELERGVVYTFASGWAEQWKHGRVLLLGDAAHLMPPFAGQGLAAGFRDCQNLIWKLHLVLTGRAGAALLDTYESERIPHVEEFIAFSMSLGRIICITDGEEARQRDDRMMLARARHADPDPPPAPRLGPGLHTGRNGGLLSWQGLIRTPDEEGVRRFDDVFGAGDLILGEVALPEAITPRAASALADLGIAVTSFATGDEHSDGVRRFTDVNGTYRAWFDRLGAAAVLVRADFSVFGTADGVDEIERLVDDFIVGVGEGVGVVHHADVGGAP
jgi:3-(3-hydroxy-phenyl)propionate hydroxylase